VRDGPRRGDGLAYCRGKEEGGGRAAAVGREREGGRNEPKWLFRFPILVPFPRFLMHLF